VRPPQNAVDGLMQAVSTVPQDQRARMMLVGELANEGKLAEAIYYLGPLAYDPHGGRGENSALALINELKQRLSGAKAGKPTS
jgi:hypothetical protein